MQHRSVANISEPYMHYPQFFHFILALLPEKVYRQHYRYVGVAIKISEVLIFNCFLLGLTKYIALADSTLVYANIVFNLFPFSFAIWNAKNSGLSARGIGLVIGQLFTYILFFYTQEHTFWLFFLLLIITLVSIITSQMSLQFILLTSPLFALIYSLPEILLLPFLSGAIFYIVTPSVAKSFFIGQFNRKRNNVLFQGDVYMLRLRPSIYRDFVYDFWKKLYQNFRQGLSYIYYNPIVEVAYGFPYLWALLYVCRNENLNHIEYDLLYIVVASGFAFVATSFRLTRFLGEPQRYMEFTIPVITVLFALKFTTRPDIILAVTGFALLVIVLGQVVFRVFVNTAPFRQDRQAVLEFCAEYCNNPSNKNQRLISNDNDLLKFFPSLGIDAIRPNLTTHYKDKEDFNSNYHNGNFHQVSVKALKEYYEKYTPKLLVLNTKIYCMEFIQSKNIFLHAYLINTAGDYEVYELH